MNDETQDRIKTEQELLTYSGQDRVVPSADIRDYLHELHKNKREVSMRSAIPGLDFHIQTFDGGELTVISGPSGNGKTLFCQTLTSEFFRQGKNCLWFTYEVPARQFLTQFDDPLPIFYMPLELSNNSMGWIAKKIIETKAKYGCDAVFIDHLHFLIDMRSKNNIALDIGFVMREIKQLAIKYNIAIFLLAHVNRVMLEAEPDLNSLRDSAMIGCEADNVFFIWRVKDTNNEAILKIAKNRKFGVMGKKIRLRKVGKFLREESLYD